MSLWRQLKRGVKQIFGILIEIEGLHLELGQSSYKG